MYENTPHIPRNRRDSRLTEYPAELRKTASSIYTDKVILSRRGKIRKEKTNRKEKKQQFPFHTQILDSDKYSFFYAKCIGRMKHLLHGWQ